MIGRYNISLEGVPVEFLGSMRGHLKVCADVYIGPGASDTQGLKSVISDEGVVIRQNMTVKCLCVIQDLLSTVKMTGQV